MESSWKRHLGVQCRAVFTPVKTAWGESRTKAHQQELKPRTHAKVCGETSWTDGETSRKAECTNKVMFGDAQWAWKSILLPLAPEWLLTEALQETPSPEKSGMSDIMMEEYSLQPPACWEQWPWTRRANMAAGRSEKQWTINFDTKIQEANYIRK